MALAMARPWKHPKSGVYWLRKRVPDDLREIVGKREEKRSLRTKDAREAKRLFSRTLAEVEAQWDRVRSDTANPARSTPRTTLLTEAEAHERSAWLYRYWLACNAADPGKTAFWDADAYGHLWHEPHLDFLTDSPKPRPIINLPRVAEMEAWCFHRADELSEVHDWDLDEGSRLSLAKSLAAATQRASLTLAKVARGELDPAVLAEAVAKPTPAVITFTATGSEKRVTAVDGNSVSLRSLLEGWWTEAKAGGRKPSTYESYRNTFEGFAAFLKRDDARSVTPEDVLAYKDFRLTTPSARTGRVASAKTVKDSDLSALKTVFGWAVINRKVATNPALGIQIKVGKAPRLRSKGFTDTEAQAILAAALAHEPGNESAVTAAAKKWVPWLCAFTGARVGEIAQLRKQDVTRQNGLWIIRITPEAGTVKTNDAREVVVHEQVVEIGFGVFVQAAGQGPLFLKPAANGDVLGPLQDLVHLRDETSRVEAAHHVALALVGAGAEVSTVQDTDVRVHAAAAVAFETDRAAKRRRVPSRIVPQPLRLPELTRGFVRGTAVHFTKISAVSPNRPTR